MKKNLRLVCICVLLLYGIVAAKANVDSSYNNRIILTQKSFQSIKQKIADEFPKVDAHFFPLADSAFSFSQNPQFSSEEKFRYANTLLRFITVIYNSATDEEMANGKLNDGFKYFILLAEWDNKKVLEENIRLYRKFTLSYASLIPDDNICEKFIVAYSRENPTEVLRYAAQFGQRTFALDIIDSMAIAAPDLVKKYLYSENDVSDNIVRSKSPASKYLLSVYRTYGQRSDAYLLAYNVLKNEFSMDAADSLGDNPQDLFKILVSNLKKPDAFGKHSIYQVLENYSIDQVRKANEVSKSSTGYAVSDYFKNLSSDDLFTIMVYGHKELSLQAFTDLLGAIKRRIYNPYSYNFISSISPAKLKQFLAFCERNEKLDVILQMVDGKSLNYLYQLMSQVETPNMKPDFNITDSLDIQQLLHGRLPEIALTTSLNRTPKTEPDKDPLPEVITKETESIPVETVVIETPAQPIELPADNVATNADAVLVKPIVLRLSEKEKAMLSLKKNLTNTLKEIPLFINESYAEELLTYAAKHEPDEIFKRFEAYKTKAFATRILETAGKASPTSMKRYIYNASHPVSMLLDKSTDSVVKQIMKMPHMVGYQSKAYTFMDAIVKGKLTPGQAENLCNAPQCLFKELVAIAKQKEYIGYYSVERELTDFSLRFLREINDNIALNESEPFRIVESFSQEEIYFLMVFGREEVVTGSFNGLYARLKSRIKTGNVVSLLNNVNHNRFRTFISMCGAYGKLEEVLNEMSTQQRDTLLVQFTHLSKNENNNDGVEIAETLNSIKNPQVLLVLHSQIKIEYEKAERDSNNMLLALYSVLASLVDGSAVVENNWFNTLSKQIKLPAVSQLPTKNLIAEKQRCIEQMYFYNDVDGRESFTNFLNTFKVLPTWKTEDKGSYVMVKSVEGNDVEIYANKPEYETNGQDAINDYLKANDLTPTVVIHRGHSFHTASTLQNVNEHVKLLLVGSCGGFYKLSYAIDNAPDAHIIATKQIGTKNVNDPILLNLCEAIRVGKNIVWKDFWEQMRQKIGTNPHFADYVPPHQNLKSLFSRAYFSLLGV